VTANSQSSTKSKTSADLAKDSTLQKQLSVIQQLQVNAYEMTAAYGKNSDQAQTALAALDTTEAKWGSDNSVSLNSIKASMASSEVSLDSYKATLASLDKSGAGTLQQSEAMKSTLNSQLSVQQSHLATDISVHASTEAITAARGDIRDTKTAIGGVQDHIDQLKSITSQITKTTDTLASEAKMEAVMKTIDSDVGKLHSDFTGGGINVAKLPTQSMKTAGTISLRIT
jgi:chromosome segregation ATPase